MRHFSIIFLLVTLVAGATLAEATQRLYRWVDKNGVVHYGDSVPPEYAEVEKQVLNDAGVTVQVLRGKRTAEERAEEEKQRKLAMERELQRRADQALLATYLSVDEIELHRNRRVELFQAQARVTELYLRNLERRLQLLLREAAGFQPYSSDPDAPMIDRDLADELRDTRETIERHQANLERFRNDEQQIVARFDNDIGRFRQLKGLN